MTSSGSSSECYKHLKAYGGEGVEESLVEHLLNVAKVSKDLAACAGVEPEPAYVAGILHDVGKAISYYQSHGSFPGHEIVSAIIAYVLIKRRCLGNVDSLAIIAYPILMHHQAHRDVIDACKAVERVLEHVRLDREVRTMLDLINYILRGVLGVSDCNVSEDAVKEVLQKQAFRVAVRGILNDVLRDVKTLMRARVYAGMLMMADKYVAVRARGGGPNIYANSDEYFNSIHSFLTWCRSY